MNLCSSGKNNISRVSAPLQDSHFFSADSPYIHSCFNLSTTATSLQWPFSSVPKVAVVETFNCKSDTIQNVFMKGNNFR